MTSITLFIFATGLLVTGMTLAGAFLIGLSEAADSDHARPGDLSELERRLVDREGREKPR